MAKKQKLEVANCDLKDEQNSLRSQFVTLKNGRGQHKKYLPYAFTRNGIAMLSSVLKYFLIIDDKVYLLGASLKDIGTGLCAITEMAIEPEMILELVKH